MANVILVLGPTGSGKSRSVKHLDPETTYLISCLGKDLPFKGSRKIYNRENKNYKEVSKWKEVMELLTLIPEIGHTIPKENPEQKKPIKTIVLDDIRYVMENEFIERALEIGYTKFTQIGQHMVEILTKARNMADKELDIFLLMHTDDVFSGPNIVKYKAKLVGKLVEEHFDPLEMVTIALFTNVKYNPGKPTEFSFITNRTNLDGITIPAKSPEDMFDLEIENDLQLVKNKIHEYYKEV